MIFVFAWLISLKMIISVSIHDAENGIISHVHFKSLVLDSVFPAHLFLDMVLESGA